jgi:FtsZ-binding cell division protein ZapB
MAEESDHKRNLMRERDYLSERLPEVMMERQRLKAESEGLKVEKAEATPERLKSIRRRQNYIKRRIGELRTEHETVTGQRRSVNEQLKALKKA